MKYKDYYAILGLKRDATADDIKAAYRRLARKYHPDVSKEKDAEEKFKEMAEAYETLKDPEKRAAYDQLGSYTPGQEFRPSPDWGEHFARGQGGFDDLDLSSLFAGLSGRQGRGGARRADRAMAGSDYEAVVRISLEQAFHGAEIDLELSVLEWSPDGGARRVPHRVKTRIPRGVTDGEKLRVPGKGGKGVNGGPDGDLYLDVEVTDHPLYRVSGPGSLHRPAAGTLGGDPRHQRAIADSRRRRRAQGAGRHAGGTAAAPGGPGHGARRRRRRSPVRDGAHRGPDGRRRRAACAVPASSPRPRTSIRVPTWSRRLPDDPRHHRDAVCLDASVEVTWTELVSAAGLPEEELRELVRYGALVPRDPEAPTWTFEARWLVVARTASRIRHDFELDPYGVSVVLGYVERIERLEAEIRALRAKLG